MFEIGACETVSREEAVKCMTTPDDDVVFYESFEEMIASQVNGMLQPPVNENPFGEVLRTDTDIGIDPRSARLVAPSAAYREELMFRFAHAIPSYHSISYLSEFNEIVEIGAGKGYWAFLLEQVGVDVMAVDSHPGELFETGLSEYPEYQPPMVDETFADLFTDVEQGYAWEYDDIGGMALFLCWPPNHDSMAVESFRHYIECGGETLLYLGEGAGGAHADQEFFNVLRDEYEYVRTVHNLSWNAYADALHVYTATGEDPVDEFETPYRSDDVF